MTTQERINELMKDEAFVAAFEKVTSPQDVVDLFHDNGVEVPLNIAQELFQPEIPEGELTDENLDQVAGGGLLSFAYENIMYGAGYLGARIAGWDKKKSQNYANKCKKFGSAYGTFMEWVL